MKPYELLQAGKIKALKKYYRRDLGVLMIHYFWDLWPSVSYSKFEKFKEDIIHDRNFQISSKEAVQLAKIIKASRILILINKS